MTNDLMSVKAAVSRTNYVLSKDIEFTEETQ